MIIRRRHTANFTTIGNVLFEDERLSADEVGILAFLLSKPHDWEVRRPALMKRWRIGRDAIRRVVHNWMLAGWCHAQKTRLADGTFAIVYEIRDEPGPGLTEEEIKRALSLVSGEATQENSKEKPPDICADALRNAEPCSPPPTSKPPLAEPPLARAYVAESNILNTELPRREDRPRAPLIDSDTFALAAECLRALAIDPDHPPPEWCGLAYQIQILLTRGCAPITIAATFAQLAGRNPRPHMNYFVKAVETAQSKPKTPIRSGKSDAAKTSDGSAGTDWRSSRDAFRDAFATLRAFNRHPEQSKQSG